MCNSNRDSTFLSAVSIGYKPLMLILVLLITGCLIALVVLQSVQHKETLRNITIRQAHVQKAVLIVIFWAVVLIGVIGAVLYLDYTDNL